MSVSGKIYFASDFHLGAPNRAMSLEREKKIVQWLDIVSKDAAEIFLVGDIFDFWFEYKHVVPKGHVRLLGKIAELTDKGIPIHVFIGNHDMWMFDYLPTEIGIKLCKEPITRNFSGKKFYIGHGDGLGPGDNGYKIIKKIFANPFCQWAFARLHPNFGISIANFWSRKSRAKNLHLDEKFTGNENEWLVQYCEEISKKEQFDFFIFGHRHLPLDIKLSNGSKYLNLGDWLRYNTYAVFDGENLELKKFD